MLCEALKRNIRVLLCEAPKRDRATKSRFGSFSLNREYFFFFSQLIPIGADVEIEWRWFYFALGNEDDFFFLLPLNDVRARAHRSL